MRFCAPKSANCQIVHRINDIRFMKCWAIKHNLTYSQHCQRANFVPKGTESVSVICDSRSAFLSRIDGERRYIFRLVQIFDPPIEMHLWHSRSCGSFLLCFLQYTCLLTNNAQRARIAHLKWKLALQTELQQPTVTPGPTKVTYKCAAT